MPQATRIRPHAIAGLVVATTSVIALALWMQRITPTVYDEAETAWIGFPDAPFDASDPQVRHLLAWVMGYGVNQDELLESLALRCGNHEGNEAAIGERYVAHIGSGAFGQRWQVVMNVGASSVNMRWERGMPPPPPEPPAGSTRTYHLMEPSSQANLSREALEPVRAAWTDPQLWQAPQTESAFNCLDGNAVGLQACVHGRYVARWRNCDDSSEAATRLWEAFNQVLPAPAAPYWVDDQGNRVDRVPPDNSAE